MATETLGASFGIDVTNLKAGLAQANRLIRESESQFKSVAASTDDWTKSQEGLEARISHLNNAQDLQKKKVEALKAQYEEAGYAADDMSAAAVQLRTQINNEQTALNKTEKELNEQIKALEELKNTSGEAGDAVEDVGDSAKDAGDGFTVAGGAIATFIGNGLTALVGAAKNAIGSLLGLEESTREYRKIMASLDESSKLAGYSADETGQTFSQLNGVLGDTQAAATTTANLQAMGLEQSKLTELTNGAIGAWSKYGDSIPIDGLGEAINHSLQLGSVQGNLADVIEWGGGTVEDFNAKLAACSNETERADLITKLFAEQGLTEAGKAWQANNKDIVDANNAQAEYEKNTAKLGEKIAPVIASVKDGFNSILEKVLELVDGVNFDSVAQSIQDGFGNFIDNVLPKIVDGFQWIIDNKDVLIAGIVGIGAAMGVMNVANMIMGVVNAFKAFKAANEGATVAQWLLNAAMSANPIGLIVAAIVGLVAAFAVLWTKCEGFRNFFLNMWDGIKKAFDVVVNFFKENWQAMILFLMNPIAGLFKYFYDNFEGFRNFVDGIIKAIKDFFSNMWDSIKNGASQAWTFITGIFSTVSSWFNDNVIKPVADFFSNMWGKLKDGAKQAWDGIKSTFSKVASFFGDIFSKAWEKVKAVFSVGGKIFDGIKDGIVSAFKTVVNAIIRGINKVVAIPFNAINNVLKKIKNLSIAGAKPFKGLISTINVPKIPELAEGGVIRGATHAIIGEDGAEAVVPLERNRQWIKAVAEEMAKQQQPGMVINQTNNYKQAYTSRKEQYKAKKELAATVRLATAGGY